MRKNLLLVEANSALRDFLTDRFSEMGASVQAVFDGVVALARIKSDPIDLILLSNTLPGDSHVSFLKSKKLDHQRADIPVFLLTGRITRTQAEEFHALGVRRFFTRPLKLDDLVQAVSTSLGLQAEIDTTPSVVEAHLNEEVLYVEVGLGYNREKIRLLALKIQELLELYQVRRPKVILMLPEIEVKQDEIKKLESLLNLLLETVGGRVGWIKILTLSSKLKYVIQGLPRVAEIEIVPGLEAALDALSTNHSEMDSLGERIVLGDGTAMDANVSLRFKVETVADSGARIAVVDDDFIVQEIVRNTLEPTKARIDFFDNGKSFLDGFHEETGLVFLDIMMPGMTGFEVLGKLKEKGNKIPVIILSALSRKETVVKAMNFGVKSYLIKPLKPGDILRKTQEVLASRI